MPSGKVRAEEGSGGPPGGGGVRLSAPRESCRGGGARQSLRPCVGVRAAVVGSRCGRLVLYSGLGSFLLRQTDIASPASGGSRGGEGGPWRVSTFLWEERRSEDVAGTLPCAARRPPEGPLSWPRRLGFWSHRLISIPTRFGATTEQGTGRGEPTIPGRAAGSRFRLSKAAHARLLFVLEREKKETI